MCIDERRVRLRHTSWLMSRGVPTSAMSVRSKRRNPPPFGTFLPPIGNHLPARSYVAIFKQIKVFVAPWLQSCCAGRP
jgi:hypothetical protein